MRRLTLVRHGQAEWKDTTIPDFERPLNRRGHAEANEMARRLFDHDSYPDLVLTSPAMRTAQTATIFMRGLQLEDRLLKPDDRLYLATPEQILDVISGTGPRVEHLLVVGHNPGLSEFAQALAPSAALETFATAGSCLVIFDRDDWQIEFGSAASAAYDSPKRFFDFWH